MKAAISVIVPVFNEALNLPALHAEILDSLSRLGREHEIIYVDDGSTDGSLKELKKLTGAKIICLRRNYGQSTALDAGFKASSGDIVISMDADGQNDPADMLMLLSKLESEGLDVVAGWRKDRRDDAHVRLQSSLGRYLRRLFIGDVTHDSGCTIRAYRKEAVKSLDLGGEMHRYILALLHWKGFSIGEAVVNHRPRLHGNSKYGAGKMFRGFFDLIYVWFINKYSDRPIHFFGYVGLGAFLIAIISGVFSIYDKLAFGLSLNRNAWFFAALFFMIASLFMFCFGVIIDFLIRIHLNNSPFEKRYQIKETI